MWLSKALAIRHAAQQENTAADMGVTTIGGGSASVVTRGEQRDLEIFTPGGVIWQPRAGDTVLVVKGGVGCQERCVVAADTAAFTPEGMAPGELYLYSDSGASIYLRADGSISIMGPVSIEGSLKVLGDVELAGKVSINGALEVNGEPYRPCLCVQ